MAVIVRCSRDGATLRGVTQLRVADGLVSVRPIAQVCLNHITIQALAPCRCLILGFQTSLRTEHHSIGWKKVHVFLLLSDAQGKKVLLQSFAG